MGQAPAKLSRSENALNSARKRADELKGQASGYIDADRPVPPPLRLEIERAEAVLHAAELEHRYGHKQGTPETYAKIDEIGPTRIQTPLSRMYERGELSDDQWRASTEIAAVAEMIELDVCVRGASLEARVDNAGASRDHLIESLGRVRLERTYTRWRNQLPMPRRMYLDMILSNRSLVATARVYGQPWRKARQRMLTALNAWDSIKEVVWKDTDAEDVAAIYAKLGCGAILPPKPRLELVLDDEPEDDG